MRASARASNGYTNISPHALSAARVDSAASCRAGGARGYFDALAIHPHSATVAQAIQRVWTARSVMNRFHDGRKALWVTEFAWAGGDPDAFLTNPTKQRTEIFRFFAWPNKNRGRVRLQQVFWYGWIDLAPPAGTTDPAWWGLSPRHVHDRPEPEAGAGSTVHRGGTPHPWPCHAGGSPIGPARRLRRRATAAASMSSASPASSRISHSGSVDALAFAMRVGLLGVVFARFGMRCAAGRRSSAWRAAGPRSS